MLNVPGHPDLKKIVVLNPKGGSGKSTMVTNLAGMLAARHQRVALMDCDPQGSSTRWLARRDASLAPIYGIAAYEHDAAVTRSFQMRVPADIRCLVVDTPAALAAQDLAGYTRGAHAILVPVLPSAIDIHAVTRLIERLLLVAKVSRRMGRLGVIANRVRENTVSFRKLKLFLDRLDIATICQLRDSQSYVHAAEDGRCIHEMQPSKVAKDLEQWQPLIDWLALRLETPLTVRDLHGPGSGRHSDGDNVRYLADALK
jgi:chromosome partitioning protein